MDKKQNQVEPFWQWLVLTGAVVANAISGGITYSYGVTYTDSIDRLETPPTEAIIPAAIAFAAFCGVAPFTRVLTSKLGSRIVTVLGSIVASLGLILCSVAPTIHYYYAFFGLLVGGGYGMIGMASWLIVREYFGPTPNIANTLYACGFPVGVFIFSLITRVLYDNFSYFGTFLISAAIMMNCFVCALLFRPIAQVRLKGVMRDTSVYEQMGNPVENVRYTPNGGTASDRAPAETEKESDPKPSENNDQEALNPKDAKTYKTVEGPTESIVVSANERSFKFEDTVLYESDNDDETNTDTNKQIPDKPNDLEGTPVDRFDEEPQFDEPDAITPEQPQEELEPVSTTLLEVIVGVSDVRTLCNWRLLLFLLAGMVYSLGFGLPFCLYPNVGRFNGHTDSQSIWTLALIGITATIGITVSGALSRLFMRSSNGASILFTALAMIATGLVTGFVEYYSSLGLLLLGAMLFGLFGLVFYFMREPILRELLDETDVESQVTMCTFFNGFGFLIGIPIAAWLREDTGNYDNSFIMVACCCGVAAFLLTPLLIWRRVVES